jgi:hypothetical protein
MYTTDYDMKNKRIIENFQNYKNSGNNSGNNSENNSGFNIYILLISLVLLILIFGGYYYYKIHYKNN